MLDYDVLERGRRPGPAGWVAGSKDIDRAVEANLARAQQDESITHTLDVRDDVGREHDSGAGLAPVEDECVKEATARERVQVRERLIEQQDLGPKADGDREAELRRLAAGQASGPGGWGHAEGVEPLTSHASIEVVSEVCGEVEMILDGQLGVERGRLSEECHLPEHRSTVRGRVATQDRDVARRRALEPHPCPQERRLAGAVRPDERGDGPCGDIEIQTSKRDGTASVALHET